MNKETAQFLVEVTDYYGNQEATIRENYSGRGMYGRETVAIVVDSFGQLLADVLNYIRDNIGDYRDAEDGYKVTTWEGSNLNLIEEIGQFSVDSMGHGVVIY